MKNRHHTKKSNRSDQVPQALFPFSLRHAQIIWLSPRVPAYDPPLENSLESLGKVFPDGARPAECAFRAESPWRFLVGFVGEAVSRPQGLRIRYFSLPTHRPRVSQAWCGASFHLFCSKPCDGRERWRGVLQVYRGDCDFLPQPNCALKGLVA